MKQQLPSRPSNEMFWFTLVEPETLLMIYVQSIRESNFKLFVSHLHNIIPWMFALDQIH